MMSHQAKTRNHSHHQDLIDPQYPFPQDTLVLPKMQEAPSKMARGHHKRYKLTNDPINS